MDSKTNSQNHFNDLIKLNLEYEPTLFRELIKKIMNSAVVCLELILSEPEILANISQELESQLILKPEFWTVAHLDKILFHEDWAILRKKISTILVDEKKRIYDFCFTKAQDLGSMGQQLLPDIVAHLGRHNTDFTNFCLDLCVPETRNFCARLIQNRLPQIWAENQIEAQLFFNSHAVTFAYQLKNNAANDALLKRNALCSPQNKARFKFFGLDEPNPYAGLRSILSSLPNEGRKTPQGTPTGSPIMRRRQLNLGV